MSKEIIQAASTIVEKEIVRRFLNDSEKASETGKQKDLKRAQGWSKMLNEPDPENSVDDKALPKPK